MVLVVHNASQLICVARKGERVRPGADMGDLAIINNGAMILRDGRIDWVGRTSSLPLVPPDAEVIDATGKTVLPGFVDSHTHLIFAGSREDEFEQRLQGMSYQDIAAQGGGINATVRRVRQASKAELTDLA